MTLRRLELWSFMVTDPRTGKRTTYRLKEKLKAGLVRAEEAEA